MARAASDALVKISAVVPADIARAADRTSIHAFRMTDLDAATRDRLDLLDSAVHESTRLNLHYTDETGSENHSPGPAARARLLGQGLDARRVVRVARCLPHVSCGPHRRRGWRWDIRTDRPSRPSPHFNAREADCAR